MVFIRTLARFAAAVTLISVVKARGSSTGRGLGDVGTKRVFLQHVVPWQGPIQLTAKCAFVVWGIGKLSSVNHCILSVLSRIARETLPRRSTIASATAWVAALALATLVKEVVAALAIFHASAKQHRVPLTTRQTRTFGRSGACIAVAGTHTTLGVGVSRTWCLNEFARSARLASFTRGILVGGAWRLGKFRVLAHRALRAHRVRIAEPVTLDGSILLAGKASAA